MTLSYTTEYVNENADLFDIELFPDGSDYIETGEPFQDEHRGLIRWAVTNGYLIEKRTGHRYNANFKILENVEFDEGWEFYVSNGTYWNCECVSVGYRC